MHKLSKILIIIAIVLGASASIGVASNPSIDSIELNYEYYEMYVDQFLFLEVDFNPSGVNNQDIVWSSSNEDVVKVDQSGGVNPLSVGSAVITATAYDGTTVQCTIKIKPYLVEKVDLSCLYTEIEVGHEEQISATIYPEKATDKTLTWSSSNSEIVSVDNLGNIKANGPGSATITATSSNGIVSTKTFEVKEEIELINIYINENSISLEKGHAKYLSASILPGNATDKTLTWESNNTNCVTVDQNGKIVAVSVGNATITVTTSNGKKAHCYVQVPRVPATMFYITNKMDALKLNVGDSLELKYSMYPLNATDSKITLDSSNEDIVSVNNGVITVKATGTVVINARLVNTNLSDSIILNIYK